LDKSLQILDVDSPGFWCVTQLMRFKVGFPYQYY